MLSLSLSDTLLPASAIAEALRAEPVATNRWRPVQDAAVTLASLTPARTPPRLDAPPPMDCHQGCFRDRFGPIQGFLRFSFRRRAHRASQRVHRGGIQTDIVHFLIFSQQPARRQRQSCR
jgi:hypothetical protein